MTGKLKLLLVGVCALFLPVSRSAPAQNLMFAQDVIVPAGTILQCTLEDSRISSKTTEIGEPILCDAGALSEFGVPVFPRGAYLKGRFAASHDPGHLWGKGSMRLEFDQILLPGAELPLSTKVTAAPPLKVDAHGTIHGRGHARRDAVEWAIPILWPVKIVTLPMRGPRPVLKGESRISVKLMEDLLVPGGAGSLPGYRAPLKPGLFRDAPVEPQENQYPISAQPFTGAGQLISMARDLPAIPAARTIVRPASAPNRATLLMLRNGSGQLVLNYWFENGQSIRYLRTDGNSGVIPIEALDFATTVKINRDRGIAFVIRSRDGDKDEEGDSQ